MKELHVAPMLNVSNRDFRNFFRILTKRAVLWTEMIVDDTVVHSSCLEEHLGFNSPAEHVVVCQIGGNNPTRALHMPPPLCLNMDTMKSISIVHVHLKR